MNEAVQLSPDSGYNTYRYRGDAIRGTGQRTIRDI